LLAAIDDATGQVVAAHFRPREDAAGYLALLQQMIVAVGRPEAVYHDGHGIFARCATDRQTVPDQLAGQLVPTQVERALLELEIRSIRAGSPQAKGRIERLFGTLQDRLVNEFILDGITTLEAAQTALPAFLARHNAAYQVPPTDPVSAWRALAPTQELDQMCALAYVRTVTADNTVRLGERTLQLTPAPDRASFAKCRVELRQHLDGAITVWWHDRQLATVPAPPATPQLRALAGDRVDPFAQRHDPFVPAASTPHSDCADPDTAHAPRPTKPAPDHPWRKPYKSERTFSQNS
jgi:hypothetical protein